MVYAIGMLPIMGQYPEEEFLDGSPRDIKLREPLCDDVRTDIRIHHALQYCIGCPVQPQHVPTTWRWGSSQPLPDFYTPQGFPCVSSRMKETIEKFEPDIHQFFPLKVINDEGETINDHFLWVVCNRLDSVDRDNTNWFFRHNCLWTPDYFENEKRIKIDHPKLVFNRSQTEGHHFWRDKYLKDRVIYASDEAGRFLSEAHFDQLGAGPRRTV